MYYFTFSMSLFPKSKFEKLSDKVINFQADGYFSIRCFRVNSSHSDVISDFIKTRYFSWQEEFRDKVTVTVDRKKLEVDWNFHGLYDIKLLSRNCFCAVSFNEFINGFVNILKLEIGERASINEVQKALQSLKNTGNDYYSLNQLPEAYKHKWSVFDFFHSGFVVNEQSNILTVVECGQD